MWGKVRTEQLLPKYVNRSQFSDLSGSYKVEYSRRSQLLTGAIQEADHFTWSLAMDRVYEIYLRSSVILRTKSLSNHCASPRDHLFIVNDDSSRSDRRFRNTKSE